MTRDVTQAEIDEYNETGAVKLSGILEPSVLQELGQAIEEAIYKPPGQGVAAYDTTAMTHQLRANGVPILEDRSAYEQGPQGSYRTTIGGHSFVPGLRRFAVESPLPYIASRLFGSERVVFYDDQVLIKEPGTGEYTAFHTDSAYYSLAGEQICAMWVSPDVITEEMAPMQYVRGSHRWGKRFKPNAFVTQLSGEDLGMGEGSPDSVRLPDIEGHSDDYDIVTYTSQPGDVLVHHSQAVHGSGANRSRDRIRRAVSVRYVGDDVTYLFNREAPPQPHQQHNLSDGDDIACEQFPIVWSASADRRQP